MIEQNVQVVRCSEQRIWVRLGSRSGCSACDNGKGCGAGVFAKLLQRKPAIIELSRQDVDVEAGQMVTLSFPEQVYLRMVMAYYGWPLLLALGGAAIAYSLGSRLQLGAVMLDVATLFGGLLAGGGLLFVQRKFNRADVLMDALKMANYYPSATPDLCSSMAAKTAQD